MYQYSHMGGGEWLFFFGWCLVMFGLPTVKIAHTFIILHEKNKSEN
jgi:hypothetical protein